MVFFYRHLKFKFGRNEIIFKQEIAILIILFYLVKRINNAF